IAGGRAGHSEERGGVGRSDASVAVGVESRKPVRTRHRPCGIGGVELGRLCAPRDPDGAAARLLILAGAGVVADEPRISAEIVMHRYPMDIARRRFLFSAGALAASTALPNVLFA